MKAIAMLLLLAAPAAAQTDPVSDLFQWVKTQQVNAGVAYDMHKVKSAASWWDVISAGQDGLNIGKAGALDFIDMGIGLAVANQEAPRYGAVAPVHFGNIWNTVTHGWPPAIANHVNITSLPNVTLAPMLLWPKNLPLNRWTWRRDFQVALAYRFGGVPPTPAAVEAASRP